MRKRNAGLTWVDISRMRMVLQWNPDAADSGPYILTLWWTVAKCFRRPTTAARNPWNDFIPLTLARLGSCLGEYLRGYLNTWIVRNRDKGVVITLPLHQAHCNLGYPFSRREGGRNSKLIRLTAPRLHLFRYLWSALFSLTVPRNCGKSFADIHTHPAHCAFNCYITNLFVKPRPKLAATPLPPLDGWQTK